MLNVLINAYSISPSWGSELGMGWNWVINIAKYCNVFVITEEEWKDEILRVVNNLPQKNNIHFYFNPVSQKVRDMCSNQGDWRFYWYYEKWQKRTLSIAKNIIAKYHIDVMHQLNMIGFREPGYLWKIKGIPLVWGPVGGVGSVPTPYLKNTGWKINLFFRLKNLISNLQFRYHPRVREAIKRSAIIAATKPAQEEFLKVYGKEVPLINETGTDSYECNIDKKSLNDNGRFNLLWVGKFDFRKRLDLALKAVAESNNPNIHLTICGSGSKEQVDGCKKLAEELGISDRLTWMGNIQHSLINEIMSASDLFLFTSIDDATSTVILEAISANLPILSFNACGFGPIVRSFAGKTIELTTPVQSVKDFANEINYFYNNRDCLREISKQEQLMAYTLSWDYKARKVLEIYNSVIQKAKMDN